MWLRQPDLLRKLAASLLIAADMTRICQQCGKRPMVTHSPWWLAVFSMFLPGGGFSERLCSDCAAGRNFVGAMLLIAIAILAFIVVVIVW